MVSIQSVRKRKFRMDMAPLIDVVFLLLIFFMLTFAVLGQGLNINLPDGSAIPSETVEKDIYLLIDPQSRVRLNGNPVELTELSSILSSELQNRKDKVVTLEAYPTTRFDLFTQVVDLSRQAGAEDFNIVR